MGPNGYVRILEYHRYISSTYSNTRITYVYSSTLDVLEYVLKYAPVMTRVTCLWQLGCTYYVRIRSWYSSTYSSTPGTTEYVLEYSNMTRVTCLWYLLRTYTLMVLEYVLEYSRYYRYISSTYSNTRIWYVLEYSRRTRVRTQVRTRRATFGSWEEHELHYLINYCVFTVLIENRNFLK